MKKKDELKYRGENFQHRSSDFRVILNEHIYVVFAKISGPFNLMTQLFCVSVSFALCLLALPFKSPTMKEILETISISMCAIGP